MEHISHGTFEQFEKARKAAIDALTNLNYENDPHFYIAVGDHNNMEAHNYCCAPWFMAVMKSSAKKFASLIGPGKMIEIILSGFDFD